MKTKNRMRKAGFTLVELIVVIAVLGILGAGAAVGYSGYVKKAAKAADEQLVSQIKYALEVAYVADPSYSGAAAVVLSKDAEANVTGEADSAAVQWVQNALTNAFGANWKNELKLEYGQWGNAAEKAKSSFALWEKYSTAGSDYDAGVASIVTGAAKPSFANNVDELFELVRDTAIKVTDSRDMSGAELIKDAAKRTVAETVKVGETDEDASAKFAEAWATKKWNITGLQGEKLDGAGYNADKVATKAVLKARNTALATYLRNNNVPQAVCDIFANYDENGIVTETNKASGIPGDVLFLSTGTSKDFKNTDITTDKQTEFFDHVERISDAETKATVKTLLTSYSTNLGDEKSQAYKDGLAYYTMMRTVSQIEASDDDAVYWDEMAGAVSLYGSIARGEASLDQLQNAFDSIDENQVAITASVGAKGLEIYANPKMILGAQ